MAPVKTLYINDSLAQVSLLIVLMLYAYWVLFLIRFYWYGLLSNADKVSERSLKVGYLWFEAEFAEMSLTLPNIFLYTSILFMFVASALDYQFYTVAGSTFVWGVIDSANPDRQWYYAMSFALELFALLFLNPFMYSNYTLRLRKALGLDKLRMQLTKVAVAGG